MRSILWGSLTSVAIRRSSAVVAAILVIVLLGYAQAATPKKTGSKSDEAAAAVADTDKKPEVQSAEKEIRATAQSFVKAFNRGDAKAVAALWTDKGTMADDEGQIVRGRKAIEEEYAAFFKDHPGATMEVAIQSIDLPGPAAAIEDGIARVVTKDGAPPAASRYTVTHVRVDGKWFMASVRESGLESPSSYGRLKQLEWMIGSWQANSEDTTVCATIRWMANRSFLEREHTVKKDGLTVSSGLQIIGWDPQANQVRSWSFDSSGGHGTALWTPTTQGWQIDSKGMLADGTSTASRDSLIRVPDETNVVGWRSTNRRVGDVQLPDTREVVMKRISEKSEAKHDAAGR